MLIREQFTLALVTIGLLSIIQNALSETLLNPNVVSRTPPPPLSPPSQFNAVMDPIPGSFLDVPSYVPPRTEVSPTADAVMALNISSSIAHDPRFRDAAINVTVEQGVVTLSGVAQTQEQLDDIVKLVNVSAGVKNVKSNVIVLHR